MHIKIICKVHQLIEVLGNDIQNIDELKHYLINGQKIEKLLLHIKFCRCIVMRIMHTNEVHKKKRYWVTQWPTRYYKETHDFQKQRKSRECCLNFMINIPIWTNNLISIKQGILRNKDQSKKGFDKFNDNSL